MTFKGAIIEEQGVTFSIICVKDYVLHSNAKINEVRNLMATILPSPIILMAENNMGIPTYQGRKDIVDFLVNIELSRIPWKEFTV